MSNNSITIELPYIGGILSVNHYKFFGGRYTRPEVKQWMERLGWSIKFYHIEDWGLPLIVTCSGRFRDKRVPDLSNLSKVILDAIEEATGVNDKNMRWRDGDVFLSKDEDPCLIITIEEVLE